MAQCAQASANLSVLDRPRARLDWHHHQEQLGAGSGCNSYNFEGLLPLSASLQSSSNANGQKKDSDSPQVPDPIEILGNGWPDLSSASYPIAGAAHVGVGTSTKEHSGSSKKRKANNLSKQKEGSSSTSENSRKKRSKEDMAGAGGEATLENELPSGRKGEGSGDTSKDNNKPPKPDYIHVRARRGQATDSHSLAERVRREKISEKMKYLQELVPGCDKIIGKAGMLDEIINYVQSLQKQVEFLSMKLATVTPSLDINMDNLLSREMNRVCTSGGVPMIGILSEELDPSCFQFNSLQQASANHALDIAMGTSDLAIQRNISASMLVPDATFDSCFHDQYSSSWDAGLHHLYAAEFRQVRGSSFPFQSFHGKLKMEM